MHAPHTQKPLHETGPDHLAPDCAGQNFYAGDRGLRDLLRHYLEPNDFRRLEPHLRADGSMSWPGPPTSTRRS